MATTTTSLTPAASIFQYQGMPDILGERTRIPRAEINFNLDEAVVTVAGAGEDQALIITCVLPPGFAYAMREVHVGLKTANGDDWDNTAWGQMANGAGATRTLFAPIQFASNGTSRGITRRIWVVSEYVKQVMIPVPGDGPEMGFSVSNTTIDGAAGTVSFFAAFLQFDIEQAHNFAVNNPLPIR